MLPPLLEFLAFPGGKNAKFRHSERMKPRSPYAIRRAWNKCVRHHNKLFGSYQISFLNQCRIQFPETIKKIIFSISPEFVYRHACINKESALAEWIVSEFNIKEKFLFDHNGFGRHAAMCTIDVVKKLWEVNEETITAEHIHDNFEWIIAKPSPDCMEFIIRRAEINKGQIIRCIDRISERVNMSPYSIFVPKNLVHLIRMFDIGSDDLRLGKLLLDLISSGCSGKEMAFLIDRFSLTKEDFVENIVGTACSGGNFESVKAMVRKLSLDKNDISYDSYWSVTVAARNGHLDLYFWLVETFDIKIDYMDSDVYW